MRPNLLLLVLGLAGGGCASCGAPASGETRVAPVVEAANAGMTPDIVALPGGSAGVTFDDLTYSPSLKRIVSLPGGTGNVDLVDPATLAITAIRGVDTSAESADEGRGLLFALNRRGHALVVIDSTTSRVVATVPLAASPDYVRWSEPTQEVWVTEPSAGQIEVLSLAAGSVIPVHAAIVPTPDGPEGLRIDGTRKRAYAHLFAGSVVSIDLAAHRVVATWATGCARSHGIPAVDEARGLVFAGCNPTKAVVLDADHDGKVLASWPLPTGETILAYAPSLGHLYVRGDPGSEVDVLGVSDDGELRLLAKLDTPRIGHGMVADDRGGIWLCDSTAGRLLRFKDNTPPSLR